MAIDLNQVFAVPSTCKILNISHKQRGALYNVWNWMSVSFHYHTVCNDKHHWKLRMILVQYFVHRRCCDKLIKITQRSVNRNKNVTGSSKHIDLSRAPCNLLPENNVASRPQAEFVENIFFCDCYQHLIGARWFWEKVLCFLTKCMN